MPKDSKLEVYLREQAAIIPTRLESIANNISAIKAGNQELLEQTINTAHQIRGTAATLGFPEVGVLAGEIEDALACLVSNSPKFERLGGWTKVERALQSAQVKASGPVNLSPALLGLDDGLDCDEVQNRSESQSRQESDEPTQEPRYCKVRDAHTASRARLLLVDDDAEFCKLATKLGKQRLIEVRCAQSQEEAEKLSHLEFFDGMLIDLHLGQGNDVYGLVEKLKENGAPFSFISANASAEQRIAAAKAGAVLFLDKPLEPEHLESAVQHMQAISRRLRARVLLIDDDQQFAEIAEAMLHRHNIEMLHAPDGNDLLQILTDVQPDLILLDSSLPNIRGVELCTLLRSHPKWQSLPIVFVTASTDWETRVAAYKAGADDYISKPLVEEELIAKVRSRIERAQLLRDRTTRDTVTGVMVRTAFLDALRAMFAAAEKERSHVTVGMLDIDSFKKVNDLGGHLIGDSVLASLGGLMKQTFTGDDICGRWGGDEFVLAFGSKDKDTAYTLVSSLLDHFTGIEFTGDNEQPFHLSFSAGLAQFPDEGTSAHELIRLADQRLYKGKAAGRCAVFKE